MGKDENRLNEEDLVKVSGGTGDNPQEGYWAGYKIGKANGYCPYCGRVSPGDDEATRGPIQEWDGRMAEVFECSACSKEYIVFY